MNYRSLMMPYFVLTLGVLTQVSNARADDPTWQFLVAASACDKAELQQMLDSGQDVNARSTQLQGYSSALLEAANCDIDVIQLLISHGADVTAKDAIGRGVIHRVAGFCSAPNTDGYISPNLDQILKLLAIEGADFLSADVSGDQPLALAVQCSGGRFLSSGVIMVRELLENGASPNARLRDAPSTVLALENCNDAVLNLLIEAKTNLEQETTGGDTALIVASDDLDMDLDLEEYLGKHGITIELFSRFDALLNAKANIEAQDSSTGETPVFFAAAEAIRVADTSVNEWPAGTDLTYKLRRLLAAGADARKRDRDGNTVLADVAQVAAAGSHSDARQKNAILAARLLMAAGADPTLKNNAGQSAIDLAESLGLSDLKAALESH